jgi:hypothetical protein
VRKLYHLESQCEPYECDGFVLACFDARYDLVTRKFVKRCGIERPDAVRIAGGAKVLASPVDEQERAFALNQIRTSMRLHGTRRALLFAHSDCGAYGGLERFGNDLQAETDHLKGELTRASQYLTAQVPGLSVEAYYLDSQGVWTLR